VYDYLCEQPSLTTPCGGHDMPGCSLTLLLRCCLYTAGVAGLSSCLYYNAACCMWHCVLIIMLLIILHLTLSCNARAVLLSVVTMVLCCLTSVCLTALAGVAYLLLEQVARWQVEHVRLLRFFLFFFVPVIAMLSGVVAGCFDSLLGCDVSGAGYPFGRLCVERMY